MSSGFPTRSQSNRAVQPQKMARGLKFRILVVEGLYYPYNENKGADQLRSYCAADLHLCFRICKKKNVFLLTRLICKEQVFSLGSCGCDMHHVFHVYLL